MSQTKAQRRKQQKAKARTKDRQKRRNVRHNAASRKWRLDVFYQGRWVSGVRYFRTWEKVEAHGNKTEKQRKSGMEIAAGRIVSLATGDVVKEIAPSPARPDGKGALPDKLVDDPEASKKGLLGGIFEKDCLAESSRESRYFQKETLSLQ